MNRRVLRIASLGFVVMFAACACASKPATATGGSGTGTGAGTASAADCASIKTPVTALYDAEAKATGAVDKDVTFVDDNVAMVMKDCAKDPGRVATCAAAATSAAQLEKDCLIPLDEEGTEGEKLAK
jgi:hypothetical protein